MQTMETTAGVLKALRPRIEAPVLRHAPQGAAYNTDALLAAHHNLWSGELACDPSGNHLRSEAASDFLRDLGWTTHGHPHEEHIKALLAARYAVEFAMLRQRHLIVGVRRRRGLAGAVPAVVTHGRG